MPPISPNARVLQVVSDGAKATASTWPYTMELSVLQVGRVLLRTLLKRFVVSFISVVPTIALSSALGQTATVDRNGAVDVVGDDGGPSSSSGTPWILPPT